MPNSAQHQREPWLTSQLSESPVHYSAALSSLSGVNLYLKRDDLLPFPLAGNKVRKLLAEFSRIHPSVTHVITNGGVTSNHCRTVALMCSEIGVKCHLILHSEGGRSQKALELLEMSGASYDVVDPGEIRGAIEEKVREISMHTGDPYVIPGGCHTPAGARAYSDAVISLMNGPPMFDDIVVASGTGATHGGIVGGLRKLSLDAARPTVHGISIARSERRGRSAVVEAANWVHKSDSSEDIIFIDDFLSGGYGKSNQSIIKVIELAAHSGILVDPTYTGKALWGLFELVHLGAIRKNANVLFWHTGGLGNLIFD